MVNGKMTFGERIKNIRKKKNITQAELGRRMGISQQTIAQYEKAVEQPKYETVVKLSRALDVSLAELTSDTSFSSGIQFFMPMIPPTVTAQEHAVRVVNGKPVFYDPPKLNTAKQKLIANLAGHIPDSPIETGCRLIVKWLFPITGNHRDGEYKYTKPDTDNLQKLLKDCMTLCGYWQDDALVVSEIVEKFWAEHPGIWICIEEIEDRGNRRRESIMKKTYRKPKMKPYNRADNQISALDYIYPGRKGYIALDETEEEEQDMPGKPDKLLVVTRHKALVDLLREKGIISGDCDYMEHSGVDDVQGRDVVGNLPLHLAARCHTITSVAMSVPLEMRGRELTLDELREVYRGVHTYRVEEVK